ncbi:MAG: hypothetical protein LUI10_07575 [Lachnospiraceae bacterium]|nr:hypothetical protein [Lachnospiraceae bacterium]
MGEANLVTVTFEIDEDILSEAEKVLAAQGLTMEAVLEGFFYWCAHYPEEATAAIRSWIAEEESICGKACL